jgi:hypothetical protein
MKIKELQGLLHDIFSLDTLPKKIKITSKVDAILDAYSKPVFKEMSRDEFIETYGSVGTVGQFTGIPIEIDDTIENEYYEIVYDNDSYLHKFIETNIEPISTLDLSAEWDGPKTKYDYLFMNKENQNV